MSRFGTMRSRPLWGPRRAQRDQLPWLGNVDRLSSVTSTLRAQAWPLHACPTSLMTPARTYVGVHAQAADHAERRHDVTRDVDPGWLPQRHRGNEDGDRHRERAVSNVLDRGPRAGCVRRPGVAKAHAYRPAAGDEVGASIPTPVIPDWCTRPSQISA